MITDKEIIAEMDKLRAKFSDENISKHFQSWNKTMQYYFPDTGSYWYIKLNNGLPEEAVKGKVSNPEISYEITTDDYFALMRGEISGLKLYNQKRLKIKASIPDIMKLQKLG